MTGDLTNKCSEFLANLNDGIALNCSVACRDSLLKASTTCPSAKQTQYSTVLTNCTLATTSPPTLAPTVAPSSAVRCLALFGLRFHAGSLSFPFNFAAPLQENLPCNQSCFYIATTTKPLQRRVVRDTVVETNFAENVSETFVDYYTVNETVVVYAPCRPPLRSFLPAFPSAVVCMTAGPLPICM